MDVDDGAAISATNAFERLVASIRGSLPSLKGMSRENFAFDDALIIACLHSLGSMLLRHQDFRNDMAAWTAWTLVRGGEVSESTSVRMAVWDVVKMTLPIWNQMSKAARQLLLHLE